MSIQLTNPFAFLEFRSPQPSDEQQSQFYEIPGVKPSPLFQSLQDETQTSAEKAAKGTTCAGCSRTTVPKRYKNPQDPTTKICQACYLRIHRANKAAEEAAKGTSSTGCSRTKARQWYKNPQDPTSKIGDHMNIQLTNPFAFLEFRSPQPSDEQQSQFYEIPAVKPSPLFQSLQDEIQKSAEKAAKGTTCAGCSGTATRHWYKNPQDPTSKICKACYLRIHRKKKAAEEAEKGTTCVDCSRTATVQWYKNPQDPTSKICASCYQRIHKTNKTAKEAAKGTSCADCSKTTTHQWYKNPQDPTTKVCHACYLPIHGGNKAVEEAATEATLLPVPSQAVSSPIPRNKRKKTSEDQVSQKRVKQSAPISHPGFQINPPPFFEPPDALDEECFSLFSAIPRQSLEEESRLPDLENEQANYPVNDPNGFLLEDSVLYEIHE